MTAELRAALAALPSYVPGRTVLGAIKMASNEMPFAPLESVVVAITSAASAMNRYPDIGAQALTGRLAHRYDVAADQIAVGCGSVALCQQLVQITCGEGDEVLYNWRSFEAYPIVTKIAGATPVEIPLKDEALDLEALAAAITDKTRLIFVCTPNNPTGTVVHRAELETFLATVPSHILVVIDEAYREFNDDPDIVDGLEMARRFDNVVVLRTLSKAFGIAGLRMGFAVGSPTVTTALKQVAIPFSVNSLAQAAALASLDAEPELLARCRMIMDERSRVRDGLIEMGYDVPPTQANFVWLPLRAGATAFASHCEDHKVIVRPFNHPGSGGVRVTIGLPGENELFLAAAAAFRS